MLTSPDFVLSLFVLWSFVCRCRVFLVVKAHQWKFFIFRLFPFYRWRRILFSYLTDFCYFPMQIVFPKVAGHGQNRSKITILKGDVDGFSYFYSFKLFYFLTWIIPELKTICSHNTFEHYFCTRIRKQPIRTQHSTHMVLWLDDFVVRVRNWEVLWR